MYTADTTNVAFGCKNQVNLLNILFNVNCIKLLVVPMH